MNAEYTRLEKEARECWNQLIEQAASVTVDSAAAARQREEQTLREAMRLGSMLFGMILVRSVQDDQAQQADQEFVDALPKKFHSQQQAVKTGPA